MPKPYYASDYEKGLIEFYIPTFSDHDGSVKYLRVAIKVVPVLDRESWREEINKLKGSHILKPNGRIDSELLIVTAQQLSDDAKEKRLRWLAYREIDPKTKNTYFIRGRKQYAGYLQMCIIRREPERAIKTILVELAEFFTIRLTKFLEPYNLDGLARQVGNWNRVSSIYYMPYIGRSSPIDYVEEQAIRCLSKSIWWFDAKIRYIYGEVAKQNLKIVVSEKLSEILTPLHELLSNPTITQTERETILSVIPQLTNHLSSLNKDSKVA